MSADAGGLRSRPLAAAAAAAATVQFPFEYRPPAASSSGRACRLWGSLAHAG